MSSVFAFQIMLNQFVSTLATMGYTFIIKSKLFGQ